MIPGWPARAHRGRAAAAGAGCHRPRADRGDRTADYRRQLGRRAGVPGLAHDPPRRGRPVRLPCLRGVRSFLPGLSLTARAHRRPHGRAAARGPVALTNSSRSGLSPPGPTGCCSNDTALHGRCRLIPGLYRPTERVASSVSNAAARKAMSSRISRIRLALSQIERTVNSTVNRQATSATFAGRHDDSRKSMQQRKRPHHRRGHAPPPALESGRTPALLGGALLAEQAWTGCRSGVASQSAGAVRCRIGACSKPADAGSRIVRPWLATALARMFGGWRGRPYATRWRQRGSPSSGWRPARDPWSFVDVRQARGGRTGSCCSIWCSAT